MMPAQNGAFPPNRCYMAIPLLTLSHISAFLSRMIELDSFIYHTCCDCNIPLDVILKLKHHIGDCRCVTLFEL